MLTSSEREKTEDRALFVAQGKRDDALKAMSAAAEDKTEKSLVTPVPLAPARERYGAMRLKSGMKKEAVSRLKRRWRKSRADSAPRSARCGSRGARFFFDSDIMHDDEDALAFHSLCLESRFFADMSE
jgi:hypothetical protein